MIRTLLTLQLCFTLLFSLGMQSVEAQVFSAGEVPPEVAGSLQCFEQYKFGSVAVSIEPSIKETAPAATMSFAGTVSNANPYPLIAGTLSAKIFRRDADLIAAGDGYPVVAQFVIERGVTIPANGSIPVAFTWDVPAMAEQGEYLVGYFFSINDRHHLSGLSFSDDVFAGQTTFTLLTGTPPQTLTELEKAGATINGEDYQFVAFPRTFSRSDSVVLEAQITNTSEQIKNIPVQWNQYAFDDLSEENRRFTQTQLVTLAPGETKTVSYTVARQAEAVTYVVATAQDGDAKSYLNFRFVNEGSQESRTQFASLTKFPLLPGDTTKLFACAAGLSPEIIPDATLELTLKDPAGEVLSAYTYTGPLTSAVSGFGQDYTADRVINAATLEVRLLQGENIIQSFTMNYDCNTIDPTACGQEEQESTLPLMTYLVTGTIILLLIAVGAVLWSRFRTRGPNIVASLCFVIIGLALAPSSYAASVVATGLSSDFFYDDVPGSPSHGISVDFQANFSVAYFANVRNLDTGNLIAPGTSIPVGTTIRVEPKNRSAAGQPTADISWNFNGSVMGTPQGAWDNYPAVFNFIGTGQNVAADNVLVFASLQVPKAPEVINLSGVPVTNLGSNTYRVDGPGNLIVEVVFPQVLGRFGIQPLGEEVPATVTEQKINFNFTVTNGGPIVGAGGTSVPRPNALANWAVPGAAPAADFTLFAQILNEIRCTFGVCSPAVSFPSPDAWGMTPADACAYAISVSGLPANAEKTCSYERFSASIFTTIMGAPVTIPGIPIVRVDVYVGNPSTQPQCNIELGTANILGGIVDQSTCSVFTYPGSVVPPPPSPPATPTITGPNTGNAGQSYTFGITATDPDNNQIRYGLDTDLNGTVDQWLPASGRVNSGDSQNYSRIFPVGTHTFRALAEDSTGLSSGWAEHTIVISAVSATPDLRANGSDGPIAVNINSNVTLTWTSTYAGNCTLSGANIPGTVSVPANSPVGGRVITVTQPDLYILNCGGEIDSVQINLNNQNPNPPTVNYVSGVLETNQTITFSIQGTDPEGASIFYEIDWDNDGAPNAATPAVPSGTPVNTNRSWPPPAGTKTFQVRTVEAGGTGQFSTWTVHQVTLAEPPPPTITFEVQVQGGGWGTGNPPPVDTNSTIELRWDSTNATTCTGTNFNTGGLADDMSGRTVTTPTAGNSTTFTITCTGGGGSRSESITVTAGLPNYSTPAVTHTLGTFDIANNWYNTVTVSFFTRNNGVSGIIGSAPYRMVLNTAPTQTETGTISPLPRNTDSPSYQETFTNVPFGPRSVTVEVDTPIASGGSVTESDESDNTATYTFGGMILPPDPIRFFTATPTQVRNGQTATLAWEVNSVYPGMTCRVVGPNLTLNNVSLVSGTAPTAPINAKSEYTFSCTEPVTGEVWTRTAIVETQGTIEEI